MPPQPPSLHLTKVAFGTSGVEHLRERLAARGLAGRVEVNTRYLPTRHAEIAGGSLFWIFKHQLVARSPILGFAESVSEPGRVAILIDPALVLVQPRAKRAHQGWRYLAAADAPPDMSGGDAAELPPELAGRLAELGLL